MHPPTDDRDPVDVLAEEFADRLRRGEHPSVGDYAAAHPDHADQLRELLPAVAQLETLKRLRPSAGPAAVPSLPDRFGDFRIVRELGRGGMGVVFEAVQESLGRPVALKVLATHAQLDATRRERFVREAQAAARLHHTNIVPVFGVGEQDGIPYYVMQLIRGSGLHSVVQRWRWEAGKDRVPAGSTVVMGDTGTNGSNGAQPGVDTRGSPPGGPRYGDWAFAAEVAVQAADALHYAHQQGVLHRDVKPANLILDPAGRVWVADFGLAKMVEQHGLTASGDILGTLQYLAPECLAGATDPRSDVYGLGATLYELLTLESPYPSDTAARLIKQIADTDPAPPRRLNPAVPRDLETVVLKAMAREPAHRYATARDLARDLQAVLDDRPITARRLTALGRAWRWCRRNPAVAGLSATAAAFLFLAGVVGWVGYANTKRALAAEARRLDEAEQARKDADLANARLEANLRLSLEAFEDVFEAVGGNPQGFVLRVWARPGDRGGRGGFGKGPPGEPGGWFGKGPAGPEGVPGGPGEPPRPPGGGPPGPGQLLTGEAAERAAVLEAVLAFYDRFAEQNATNPRLQLEAAKARRRVGEAQAWLGQPDKATASFRKAADQLETLVRADPADEDFRAELVLTYLLAPPDVFGEDTDRLMDRALKLARTFDRGPRAYLAGSVALKIGWLRTQAGDGAGAERAYRDALAGLAPRPGDADPPLPFLAEQTFARSALAHVLTETDRLPEARRVLEEALADEDRRRAARSGPRPPPGVVGMLQYQLAGVIDQLGDKSAAEKLRAEAERNMPGRGRPGSAGFVMPFPPGGPKGRDKKE